MAPKKPSMFIFHWRNGFNRLHALVGGGILCAVIWYDLFMQWEKGDFWMNVCAFCMIIIPGYLLIRETIKDYKVKYP